MILALLYRRLRGVKNLKSVEDFVLNTEFREWVLNPKASVNIFWENWLESNPDKKEIFQESVSLIQHLARVDYQPDAQLSKKIWENIASNIDAQADPQRDSIPLNIQSVIKKNKKSSDSGKLGLLLSFAFSLIILMESTCFTITQGSPESYEISLQNIF